MLTSSIICWRHQFLSNKEISKKPEKSIKIANINGENLLNDKRNFNEIFNEIGGSQKKAGSQPLSRKHISGKTTGKGGSN